MELPYTDNTESVLLQTRLQAAIPNMTASHLCLLVCFLFHRKIVVFYFGAFFLIQCDIFAPQLFAKFIKTVLYFLYKSSVGVINFLELLTKLGDTSLQWCCNSTPHSY